MIFQVMVIPYVLWTLAAASMARRQQKIGWRYFLVLVTAHLLILFVTLFPDATYPLAHLFGIGRGVDFVIYCALLILLRVLFYLYQQNRRLESQLTQIVRHLALEEKRQEPR